MQGQEVKKMCSQQQPAEAKAAAKPKADGGQVGHASLRFPQYFPPDSLSGLMIQRISLLRYT